MGRGWRRNSLLVALVSWVLATGLVVGGYGLYKASQGEPFRWDMAKEAAVAGAIFALFRAWKDRARAE